MKKGFTLVELSIVLVILAVVAHLAVREMTHAKSGKLHEAAQTQMNSIREAVCSIGANGKPGGFLADLGRLPVGTVSTNALHQECVTLEELWKKPEDAGTYGLRQAVASNLAVDESVKKEMEDGEVWIACGWRGPYLHVPFGNRNWTDPWGNRMENKDDAGYDRLFTFGTSPAKAGDPVVKVTHYGSDGRQDSEVSPQTEEAKDFAVDFVAEDGFSNTLAVNLLFCDGDDPSPVTGDVVCKWYFPCGSSITGGVEKISLADSASKTFSIEGLPPCECMVTIGVGGKVRLRRYVVVPPGGCAHEMKIPVR